MRTNFISRFITKRREAKTTYRHIESPSKILNTTTNRAKSRSFRSYRSRCIFLSAISMLPSATVSMTSPDVLDMNAIPSAILKRTHILRWTYFEHVRASLLLLDTTLHPLLRALKSLNNMMCPGCHSDFERQDSYHRIYQTGNTGCIFIGCGTTLNFFSHAIESSAICSGCHLTMTLNGKILIRMCFHRMRYNSFPLISASYHLTCCTLTFLLSSISALIT